MESAQVEVPSFSRLWLNKELLLTHMKGEGLERVKEDEMNLKAL